MESLRKWFYKPKKDDTSLLAQFFYADEALNFVAAALDSFDGREDPDRCTVLVNHLRQCQDKVLTICNKIMDELIPNERANRDFRAKFPDDVMQDSLAGQLWFGAECLAAGSSIMNRENESSAMRPLAKALTKSLENVRNLLREHSLRSNSLHQLNMFNELYADRLIESLKVFDQLLAEFELCYVSAMVPVKTAQEYQLQQFVIVLFSETLQRALKLGLLSQEMVDQYDPALMLTIPRLAIISGLLFYTETSFCLEGSPADMSEMFRPFRTLLMKIRELLWTLSDKELYTLERMLCSSSENTPPSSFATLSKSCKEDSDWNTCCAEKSVCKIVHHAGKVNPINNIRDPNIKTSYAELPESLNVNSSNTNLNLNGQNDHHYIYLNSKTNNDVACTSNLDFPESQNSSCKVGGCYIHLDNNAECEESLIKLGDGNSCNSNSQSCDSVSTLTQICRCSCFESTESTLESSDVCDKCKFFMKDGYAVPDSTSSRPPHLNKVESETCMRNLILDQHTESLPDDDPKLVLSLATETLSSILNLTSEPPTPVDSGICTQNNSEGDVSCSDRTPDRDQAILNLDPIFSDDNEETSQEMSFHSSNTVSNFSRVLDLSVDESIPQNKQFDEGGLKVSRSNSVTHTNALIFPAHLSHSQHSINSMESSSHSNHHAYSIYNHSDDGVSEDESQCFECNIEQSDQVIKSDVESKIANKVSSLNYNKIKTDNVRWVNQSQNSDLDQTSSLKCDDYFDNLEKNLGKPNNFDSSRNLSKVLLNHSNGVTSVILNHKVEPDVEVNESSSMEYSVSPQTSNNVDNIQVIDKFENIHFSPSSKKYSSMKFNNSSEVLSSSISSSYSSSSYPATSSCSVHSSDTSSFDSEFQDYEEIALAMQASRLSRKSGVRSKFRSSEDLIHRLFVCIAGVADQLQTNFAADLRNILKCVFLINASFLSETENIVEEPICHAEERLVGNIHRYNIEDGEEALSWREERTSPTGRRRDDREIAPAWVPDDHAPSCMACSASFTVVRRRHHCRNCGEVFCARCSSNSVPLPHYGHTKPVRVCNRCFIYQVTPFTVAISSS